MNAPTDTPSPFHQGEQKLQSLVGVREQMERFGRRVIRPFMPKQHQEFYSQLPFVFVGHADAQGWPWASILANPAGFISSASETQININCQPVVGDPLAEVFNAPVATQQRLGLLGIELPTRRRNRLSAHIIDSDSNGVQLQVDQCFGNCPQYIQSRDVEFLDPQTMPPASVEELTRFDGAAMAMINQSDTFFVASYVANGSGEASEGVDVSHRGGRPGFVRIDNDRHLTIPDYLGNNHFNTLGNILENGKAGLLFIDFVSGDILTMSGNASVQMTSTETDSFQGAERLWTFELVQARRIKNGLPLRWSFNDYSSNTLLTGTWKEAEQTQQADELRNSWQDYRVINVVEESDSIKSFYLKPESDQLTRFCAGQFITLRVTIDGKTQLRTYTVSSAPEDQYYRISVKREQAAELNQSHGLVSNFLHDNVKVGQTLSMKAPKGSFHLDDKSQRPVVFIAAGIGLTPMLSMARHILYENFRTRQSRTVTIISSAKNKQQRAFFDELNDISKQSGGSIRNYWALSQLAEDQQPGDGSFHYNGRINKEFIQVILPLDDYDFYLCGPAGFMQTMYDTIRELGIADKRIFSEEFGPASLTRDLETTTISEPVAQLEAEAAIVRIINPATNAEVEQAWSKAEGNLLDFVESHGFTPEYGCRSGQCGACKVKLVAGEICNAGGDPALVNEGEILLCCAIPAASDNENLPVVTIEL